VTVGFLPGRGPLHRAHPFTPLTLAAAVLILAFAVPAPAGPLLLCCAVLGLALVEGLPQVLKPAVLTALPFWVFLLVIHWLIGRDLRAAVGLGARVTAIILTFLIVLAAVHPGRLVDALVERGVPFAAAYVFAATLQVVPRLRRRAREILEAQRCRGLRVRGSLWGRARAVAPLAVPLVLSALAEVDDRALALEARGAGVVARRTPLDPPTDTTMQRLLRWAMFLVAIGVAVVRLW